MVRLTPAPTDRAGRAIARRTVAQTRTAVSSAPLVQRSVSHNFGSPWDERISLAERFSWIKSDVSAGPPILGSTDRDQRPARRRMGIDWMIGFEKYPELAKLFPQAERKRRLALVEDLARDAHQNLQEIVFVWSDGTAPTAGIYRSLPAGDRDGLPYLFVEPVLEAVHPEQVHPNSSAPARLLTAW